MTAIHKLDDFPDYKWLTQQYTVILDELKKNSFWMNWGSDSYDPIGHCKFLRGSWTVCPVYFGNYNPYMMKIPGSIDFDLDELIKSLPLKFPETIKLLRNIKSLNFSAFSRLHPHSKLEPHKHTNPNALIFHLGLVIPPGNTCGLEVNGQIHTWTKPGDAVIFNDNFEHRAWNNSDEERIILYVDFAL